MMNYILIYFAVILVTLLASIGLYFWMPEHGYYLYLEDHFIENLGAFVLLTTFLLGIPISILRSKHRMPLIILTIVGLLGFLVEVGFGKRWFTMEASPIGGFIVRKLNAIFSLGFYLLKRIYDSYPLVLYLMLAVMFLITIIIVVRYWGKLTGFNKWGDLTQTYLLAMLSLSLLFAGTVIDLANVPKYPMIALEELLELFSSLALFFCLLSLYRPKLSLKFRKSP